MARKHGYKLILGVSRHGWHFRAAKLSSGVYAGVFGFMTWVWMRSGDGERFFAEE